MQEDSKKEQVVKIGETKPTTLEEEKARDLAEAGGQVFVLTEQAREALVRQAKKIKEKRNPSPRSVAEPLTPPKETLNPEVTANPKVAKIIQVSKDNEKEIEQSLKKTNKDGASLKDLKMRFIAIYETFKKVKGREDPIHKQGLLEILDCDDPSKFDDLINRAINIAGRRGTENGMDAFIDESKGIISANTKPKFGLERVKHAATMQNKVIMNVLTAEKIKFESTEFKEDMEKYQQELKIAEPFANLAIYVNKRKHATKKIKEIETGIEKMIPEIEELITDKSKVKKAIEDMQKTTQKDVKNNILIEETSANLNIAKTDNLTQEQFVSLITESLLASKAMLPSSMLPSLSTDETRNQNLINAARNFLTIPLSEKALQVIQQGDIAKARYASENNTKPPSRQVLTKSLLSKDLSKIKKQEQQSLATIGEKNKDNINNIRKVHKKNKKIARRRSPPEQTIKTRQNP